MSRNFRKARPSVLPDISPSRGDIGNSTVEISLIAPLGGETPVGRGGRLARTLAILPAAILAVSTFAVAAPTLGASYGDKDGCHYAKTGESSGADTFFLLTDESITTSTAFCSFHGLLKTKGDGFQGTATCESEGESGAPEKFELLKSAKGYTVAFDDGMRWGPLPKCR